MTENQTKSYKEMQETFAEIYFEHRFAGVPHTEAQRIAKKEAGYADSYPAHRIFKAIPDELVKEARTRLALMLPDAVIGVESVLKTPNARGAKTLLDATSQIFDRTGVAKRDQLEVEVKMPDGIAILPPKVPVMVQKEE